MKLKIYDISSSLIRHSGLLNSIVFEQLVIRKQTDFSSDIYFIEIHPEDIGYISMIGGSSPFLIGTNASSGIYHGIFDILKSPYNKHFIHETVQSILLGKNIRETEYYYKLLRSMNKDDAADRVGKLERLMKIFRETGYKSQYELGKMQIFRAIGQHKVPRHEMIVGLDRKGRLFRIAGGRHRLAVAQNLKLEKMSAILSLLHRDAKNKLPVKNRVIKNYPEDFRPF